MPEALFQQILLEKKLFLDFQISVVDHSLALSTYFGMRVVCSFDTVEAMDAMTQLILQNYPKGIPKLEACPMKILQTIVSMNPEGVHSCCFE